MLIIRQRPPEPIFYSHSSDPQSVRSGLSNVRKNPLCPALDKRRPARRIDPADDSPTVIVITCQYCANASADLMRDGEASAETNGMFVRRLL